MSEEKEVEVELTSKGNADAIIDLLETFINSLRGSKHKFSMKLELKDLGKEKP